MSLKLVGFFFLLVYRYMHSVLKKHIRRSVICWGDIRQSCLPAEPSVATYVFIKKINLAKKAELITAFRGELFWEWAHIQNFCSMKIYVRRDSEKKLIVFSLF